MWSYWWLKHNSVVNEAGYWFTEKCQGWNRFRFCQNSVFFMTEFEKKQIIFNFVFFKLFNWPSNILKNALYEWLFQKIFPDPQSVHWSRSTVHIPPPCTLCCIYEQTIHTHTILVCLRFVCLFDFLCLYAYSSWK